jgi:tetratricopeptide (TPR) repeat protein
MERENAAPTESATLTRKYRTRHLWQVPVFVLGLCAVAGACAGRPLWHDHDARAFARAFSALREEMERPTPDAARARALGEEVLPYLERFRRHAGEVHHLLGSSYLLLASNADATDAPELWQRARNHLEQADALGVAPEQVNRLRYRLAKAWFNTSVEPQRVLDCLLGSVDSADDRVEGFGMIAQCYLRLPTPDVRAALQANQKQLSQPIDDDRLLAPARLLRGELFLRVKEPTLARDALARIPNSAPPEVLAKARYLRASIAQEEGLWAEAVQNWEQVLGEGTVSAEAMARVRYYMGVCYQRLNRPGEAARAWELVLDSEGIEAPAAALALAALRDAAGDTAMALKMYERFFHDSPEARAYRNELAPLPETRAQVVGSCTRWREKKDYARSQQLARLYGKLSRPGEADDLRARAADDWAAELSNARAEKKAVEQYREAAEAYVALASAARAPSEQGRGFRSAAERYYRAKDYAPALAMLDQYRKRETAPEKIGESWFLTAQIYQALENRENASGAYRKCIEFPGAIAFRARLALAQIDFEDGRLDIAEEVLKQNLELDLSYESDSRRLTLFMLADLLYKRGKYTLASQGYQEALDHYPTDARAAEARFHLGDCYRLLADLENQNLGFGSTRTPEALRLIRERYRRWLMMALANYQKLADDLSARRANAPLTEDEETLLRQAEVAQGKCQIDLGHYADAIKLFEMLTVRYRYQVEHLNALREVWRCHWMMRNPDKARETVRLMRTVLREVDPKKLQEGTGQSPEEWLQWVEWAEKQ